MSTASLRPAMVPISKRVRAYFAAVDRGKESATIFDPAQNGGFLLEAPPSPWIDLGWIDNLERSSGTTTETMRAGNAGAAAGQFRRSLETRVEFDFREWGKLQMALACGAQHMNALAALPNSAARPSGGMPVTAVALLPGTNASELIVGAGSVDAFAVGQIVAADVDYQQQTGYVGTGIAAAYVKDPADVNRDPNYIRRVTFNVGRVAEKTATSLLLAQPLLGGAPPTGASIQKVVGFVDRDGGTFFQEWSALFVAEEQSGGRICFHYPRLSPVTRTDFARENRLELGGEFEALGLHAAFIGLPYTDENDHEVAVCYRSYFPGSSSAVY